MLPFDTFLQTSWLPFSFLQNTSLLQALVAHILQSPTLPGNPRDPFAYLSLISFIFCFSRKFYFLLYRCSNFILISYLFCFRFHVISNCFHNHNTLISSIRFYLLLLFYFSYNMFPCNLFHFLVIPLFWIVFTITNILQIYFCCCIDIMFFYEKKN